ncbi:MAG: LysM peptidoglycan-binding domain-containing protein [Gemmatales bacterium]|nr:LysM peptidoglycan-binding domain-containing protein [Gemmatales bacterium]MDW8387726.1 LysM peptidoglycan-binding domain-containing protein [Gemmatales bacterium]
MPNDAKLGLVVGVGLVIAVAVVFFRKDLSGPKQEVPRPVLQQQMRTSEPKHHVVKEGETLYTIAKLHYGDGDRFYDIYLANRDRLSSPDALPVGASLRIP